MDGIMNAAIKPLITAGVEIPIGLYLSGSNFSTKMDIMPLNIIGVPFWISLAVVGIASSLIADAIHSALNNGIPNEDKFNDMTSMIIGAGAGGSLMLGLLYFANSGALLKNIGVYQAFGIGALAEVAGSYAVSYWQN